MHTSGFSASCSPQGFAKVWSRPPQRCRRMLIFMTTTSKPTSNQLDLDDLAGIRGAIITPADPQYDAARAVYNGAVDRTPLAIVRCADVADVMACVAYARRNVLPLAIRAVVTMVGVSASGMTPSSSTSAACVAPQLTRWPVRSGSMAVVSGVMLIMPPERSAWRCRQVSYPPPASAG